MAPRGKKIKDGVSKQMEVREGNRGLQIMFTMGYIIGSGIGRTLNGMKWLVFLMNYQLQAALDDGVASGKQLQREFHDQWRPKQPSGRVKVVTKVKEVMFDSFGSFQCHFEMETFWPAVVR